MMRHKGILFAHVRVSISAKEKFAQELIEADIEHIIVRPNGFFSDIKEIYEVSDA